MNLLMWSDEMTLSLDEVQSIRFPMARKPNEDGYRASAVDNFMDKLEISYAQLLEEIEKLRANQGGGSDDPNQDAGLRGELEDVRGELDAARGELESARGEAARLGEELSALRAKQSSLETANNQLREDNERLAGEINQLRGQLDELRASSDLSATGGEQLQHENEDLHRQLGELRGQLNQTQQDLASARQQADEARNAQAQGWHAPGAAETTQNMGVVTDGVRQIKVTTSAEASPAVVRLVELATDQAETLLRDADAEAQRRIDEATGQAERISSEARARAAQLDQESRARADQLDQESRQRAEQLDNETRQMADRLLGEARGRADRLDAEVRNRRAELFTDLETERDQLLGRVTQLRDYEDNYRRTFSGFLAEQIEKLGNAELAPNEAPNVDEMYGLGEPQVSTPRLDALVEESRREFN